MIKCDDCGEEFPRDCVHKVGNQIMCEVCIENIVVKCSRCKQNAPVYALDSRGICDFCRDDYAD